MKRLFALLTALALLLCGAAAAETDEGPALPQPGEKMYGFTVVDVYPYASMGAQAVEFVHDKTGATLLWIANGSTDRAFAVGFRTHVTDDKGIPHVFEHVTTSGSEKYPNPDQFTTAMNGTYSTYVNANTSTTFTLYPCSSLSEAQLLRFVDLFIDGVYHPLAFSDERLIQREAYRYDLPSPEAEITLQGSVYSEMLGAITQLRNATVEALRATFPGSAVGSEVGGVPGVIETITLEDLRSFYDTYYHPSNSLMALYGDIDVKPFLELIDGEYLSEFERKEIDLSDSGYTPITGDVEKSVVFPASENDVAQTYMIYTIPLEGMDMTESCQFSIAVNAMFENGQAFSQLVQQRLPGVSISPSLSLEGPCPSISLIVAGASPEQKDEVLAVIREGIATTLEQGLDHDLLASAVLSERIAQAQLADTSMAVDAVMYIVYYWSVAGDPLAFLDVDSASQNLQADLDAGVFDAVLAKYLTDPAASSFVISTSEPGLKEKQDAELRQRLADMKAAMSEEEIAALVAQHDEMERWNAENGATVSIAPVQAVDVQTLPEEVVAYTAKDEDVDGLRVVSSEVDSDLMEIGLWLDASGIPADRLDEAVMAMGLAGALSTEHYDMTALSGKILTVTDGILTELTSIRQEDWSYTPYAHIAFACFPEDLDAAFDLVEELLLHEKFDLQEVATQCGAYASAVKTYVDPFDYAQELAYSALSEAFAYESRVNGAGASQAILRVAGMDGEELAAFVQGMRDMLNLLCNSNGMILAVAGNAENIAAATERAGSLRALFSDAPIEPADYTAALAAPKNVAATYGSDAMYSIAALPFKALGIEYSGKLRAFASAAQNMVLIPVMRNGFSVYSPFISIGRETALFAAYRDPRLKETFTEVLPSLSDYIRDLDLTQEELDGYITNAYSALAEPVGPFTGASMAIRDVLCNRNSFERRLAEMKELKQTTPEDIAAYADIFDKLASDGARITVGSPQLIKDADGLFDEVYTWLTE